MSAKPGPKPRPTKLKLLRGVDKTHPEQVNRSEPPELAGVPECPSDFGPVARERWGWLVDKLSRLGLLSQEMGGIMEVYCRTYARWQQALFELKGDGLIIQTARGMGTHPAYRVAHTCEVQLNRMHAEFGFTPSSKSTIRADLKPQDDLESFLDEGRKVQ